MAQRQKPQHSEDLRSSSFVLSPRPKTEFTSHFTHALVSDLTREPCFNLLTYVQSVIKPLIWSSLSVLATDAPFQNLSSYLEHLCNSN